MGPGNWGSVGNSSSKSFLSCLLVAPAHLATLEFVRSLHGGGVAVLEREPHKSSLDLALSGEFDLVAWFVDSQTASGPLAIETLARNQIALIAVFEAPDPALIAEAFAAGADACLNLNTDARVVAAQIRAVLRRSGAYDADSGEVTGLLQVGDLTVDVDRCEVQRAGAFVALTASEYRIIEYMARKSGRRLAAPRFFRQKRPAPRWKTRNNPATPPRNRDANRTNQVRR